MTKIKQIYSGWKNFIFPNKEVEAIAKVRAKICAGCVHSVTMTFEELEKKIGMLTSEIGEISKSIELIARNMKSSLEIGKGQKPKKAGQEEEVEESRTVSKKQ